MSYILATVAVMAVITALLRGLPFVIFSDSKKTPKFVTYMGRMLPPAVIGMLVIYCLRNVTFMEQPYVVPSELVATLAVVLLHVWRRNVLLSITAGTIINMLLLHL